MKRVIIAMLLLVGMILLSFSSAQMVEAVSIEIHLQTDELNATYKASKTGELLTKIDNLCDYWLSVEDGLVNYIHRDQVDSLARSIAILYPLAENESWALFHAEVASIRWQMENIRRFAKFSVLNII